MERHHRTLATPCHTQAVERPVRLVTQASVLVRGRDGVIRNRIKLTKKVCQILNQERFYFLNKAKDQDERTESAWAGCAWVTCSGESWFTCHTHINLPFTQVNQYVINKLRAVK